MANLRCNLVTLGLSRRGTRRPNHSFPVRLLIRFRDGKNVPQPLSSGGSEPFQLFLSHSGFVCVEEARLDHLGRQGAPRSLFGPSSRDNRRQWSPNGCSRPVRYSTSSTGPSAVTFSAASSPSCSRRRWMTGSLPRPPRLLARDHRRSQLADRDRDRARRNKRFVARSAPRPAASLALRAVGVALPPTIRAAGETAAH